MSKIKLLLLLLVTVCFFLTVSFSRNTSHSVQEVAGVSDARISEMLNNVESGYAEAQLDRILSYHLGDDAPRNNKTANIYYGFASPHMSMEHQEGIASMSELVEKILSTKSLEQARQVAIEVGFRHMFHGEGTIMGNSRTSKYWSERYGAVRNGVRSDSAVFTKAAGIFSGAAIGSAANSGFLLDATVGVEEPRVGRSEDLSGVEHVSLRAVSSPNKQGFPFIPDLDTKEIEIVAGVLRQDTKDPTKWNYISDSKHAPVGVLGAYAKASGGTLRINYKTTYSKVISFVAAPDEILANTGGVTIGGKVGLSFAALSASANLSGGVLIKYNTDWVVTNLPITSLEWAIDSYSNGTLTLSHNYCRGRDITLSPWTDSGRITNPYIPVIKSVADASAVIQFIDPTTGQTVTGEASPRMCFQIFKRSQSGLHLDGTGGADLASGNIWFMGLFQK